MRVTGLLVCASLLAAGALAVPVGAVAASAGPGRPVTSPVRYVQPKVGTGNAGGMVGTGDTTPAAALPFGMMQWGPDTDDRTAAGYLNTATHIRGFSLSHLSGVGCDYAGNDAPMLPITGPVTAPNDAMEAFSHDKSTAEPGYYHVGLGTSHVDASLAVSSRAGIGRFGYPAGTQGEVLLRASSLNDQSGGSIRIDPASRTVTGSVVNNTATGKGGFCNKPNTYTVYFVARFDEPFAGYGTWQGGAVAPGSMSASGSKPAGTAAGAYVSFAAPSVQVRVGMSYTSANEAARNLDAEVGGRSFEQVRAAATQRWNELLGRLQVTGGDPTALTNFYTAAYHSFLHPSTFSDADGSYLGFDQKVHQVGRPQRVQYADYSGWDTYRSQASLVALVDPKIASDQAQSLVNDAEQGGWLPKWPVANQYTQVMDGDPAASIIADTYAFGGRAFDTAAALAYMRKGADHGGGGADGVGQWGYVEREALGDYLGQGYVSGNPSLTQEYSIADAAIAHFAAATGHREDYAKYVARSQNWQNTFDVATTTGPYFQQRNGGGDFVAGPGFVSGSAGGFGQNGFGEGNAAQYAWAQTNNPAGVIAALGGRQAAAARLDAFFAAPPAGTSWGKTGPNLPYYWPGNEPGFADPWMYDYVGQPYKTAQIVHRVLTQLFAPTPTGLPGNDDLGALSSWYVWAAMGLYPLNPGSADVQLTAPLFSHVRIVRSNHVTIDIDAPGASSGATSYITAATADHRRNDRPWLPADVLTRPGHHTVRLSLSSTPDIAWGSSAASEPPSDRTGEASAIGYTDPSGSLSVPIGGSTPLTVGAQGLGAATAVTWHATAPAGLHLSASDGSLDVPAGERRQTTVQLHADPTTPYGTYPVTVAFSVGSQPYLVNVSVVPPGTGYTKPSGTLTVAKGKTSTVQVGLHDLLDRPLTATWTIHAPAGVRVSPATGTLTATPGSDALSASIDVSVAADAPEGFQDITVSLQADASGYNAKLADVPLSAAVIGTGDSAVVCDPPGAPDASRGVQLVQVPIDGLTTPVTVGGVPAVKSVPAANPGRYFYFHVDPRIVHDADVTASLQVTYWNNSGTGGGFGWGVQYDSTTSPYQSASGGAVGTTDGWKTTTVQLPHARFAGEQNGGADLRISQPAAATDPAMIIRSVQLTITGTGVLPMNWCGSGSSSGAGTATVADVLGPTDTPHGLTVVGPPAADDGENTPIANVAGTGVSGRQMDQHDVNWGRYLYFDVDDQVAANTNAAVTITVTYWDDNTVSPELGVQYQSTTDNWASTPTVPISDSHTWKTTTFNLTHAALGNGEKGADFRISGGAANVYDSSGQRIPGGAIIARVDATISGPGVKG